MPKAARPFVLLLALSSMTAIVIAFTLLGLSANGNSSPVFASVSPQSPPPPPPLPLGDPAGLTAVPGDSSGEVALNWTPAANATIHWVYLVRIDGSGGRYWDSVAGDAASETVTGLTLGQEYLFIVVAGQEQDGGSSVQWSQWSNWAQSAPAGASGLPTPPPAPGGVGSGRFYGEAEIEGVVLSVDSEANTFTAWAVEYEHFLQTRPLNPVTVDYSAVQFAGSWLQTGRYVEAEGRYDPATNILYAYEVSPEDGGWYDGNARDDDDGDDRDRDDDGDDRDEDHHDDDDHDDDEDDRDDDDDDEDD